MNKLFSSGWYGPKAFIHISLLSSLFVSCYYREKLLSLHVKVLQPMIHGNALSVELIGTD